MGVGDVVQCRQPRMEWASLPASMAALQTARGGQQDEAEIQAQAGRQGGRQAGRQAGRRQV